ncbi:MAG: DsbA family oxidoreductase [Thermomonas sp.]|uniref:DsbA family oxidoreductase n=1 Tax=Thermomonas sp. TaxID=1971895 RepID=UPI001EC0F7DA|nr:DsbA family oxidoreductase [Thermomonas sp.]MBV2208053.1 DsbA family oxidoreductase [Thermomonas sp.]
MSEQVMKQLRIDFVSDVMCPWCAIGLASLEQALLKLQGDVGVDLHFQPFELNPQMPPEGEPVEAHLRLKYGMTQAQLDENQARIAARGAELGFTFDFNARSRMWNSFDAHRLLHWAGLQGLELQRALKHALLRAHFTEGRNVSDHAVLAEIAASVGLDAAQVQAVLMEGRYADDVREAEEFFRRNGITGVPAIIIEQKHLISGGQPVDVFERALREIAVAK